MSDQLREIAITALRAYRDERAAHLVNLPSRFGPGTSPDKIQKAVDSHVAERDLIDQAIAWIETEWEQAERLRGHVQHFFDTTIEHPRSINIGLNFLACSVDREWPHAMEMIEDEADSQPEGEAQ